MSSDIKLLISSAIRGLLPRYSQDFIIDIASRQVLSLNANKHLTNGIKACRRMSLFGFKLESSLLLVRIAVLVDTGLSILFSQSLSKETTAGKSILAILI